MRETMPVLAQSIVRGWGKYVWTEKTPLTLAVVAQASAVGIYMMHTAATDIVWFNLIVAIIASFALDLIIVSTAFTHKRSIPAWCFAAGTSIAALGFSVGIAVEVFDGDYLHAAYPTIVFLYSWFLSITKSDTALQSVGSTADIDGYKREIIKRLLEMDIAPTNIARIVGGRLQKSMDIVREVQAELADENT